MCKIYYAEFQKIPLKFHTKYLAHTLKDAVFYATLKFQELLHLEARTCFWNAPRYNLWDSMVPVPLISTWVTWVSCPISGISRVSPSEQPSETWRHYDMGTLSVLLAIYKGNTPLSGGSLHKEAVMQRSFASVCLNIMLNKQSSYRDFRRIDSYDVSVMKTATAEACLLKTCCTNTTMHQSNIPQCTIL